jgi:hypothetical protein
MQKASIRRFLLMAGGAITAAAVGFSLIGAKDSQQAHADRSVTTESAAAAAGAQVTPTKPKLRVEPK